ncbi:hypothetical protein K8Q96_00950 [Candidatus Nomurabacteria bacterium]|jgi:hypothetical protein|nr:hypothetical protein [Candidatus Nomurabacteria bacterium]
MKFFIKKTKTQSGYAILFTVVVVSIILTLALGLSSASYKQIVVSSVAKDSQLAFYQSDTATECALYAEARTEMFTSTSVIDSFVCGLDKNGSEYTLFISRSATPSSETYDLEPASSWSTSSNPCFNMSVSKTVGTDPIITTVRAKGYNICNNASLRAVEREIDISY